MIRSYPDKIQCVACLSILEVMRSKPQRAMEVLLISFYWLFSSGGKLLELPIV